MSRMIRKSVYGYCPEQDHDARIEVTFAEVPVIGCTVRQYKKLIFRVTITLGMVAALLAIDALTVPCSGKLNRKTGSVMLLPQHHGFFTTTLPTACISVSCTR